MAISTIYPNGINEIIVPATQSIAISNFGGGIASIYYLIVTANYPPAYQLQQTLNNSSVVLGAFADGMTIKIEAGPSIVRYDVGASPDTGIGDADTLNGLASDTAATADTIAARDSSGDITANAFESTVATGTAPFTVASTTLVTNLNADTVDGIQGSNIAKKDSANDFLGDITITTTTPNIDLNESDTLTTCRLAVSGGKTYIFAGDTGAYEQGSGDLVFAGWGGSTDINSLIVRYAGGDQNIWHDGNTTTHYVAQGAPAAQTVDDTLTAAELAARIITVNQGAAGTSSQTLPLATAMDSYFAGVSADFGFEFSVINISTNAAEDATIITNTGWTLVGSMVIESFDADRARSSGRFFARKTGTGAWTLYRIS